MRYGEKMGSDTILTEANHSYFGDPHPQYVIKAICKKIPKISDISKPYYALATVDIYNDDICIIYEFDIFSIDSSEIKTARFIVKIFVQSLLEGIRNVYIQKESSINLDDIEIKVSVIDNGSNGNTFYIYLVQNDISTTYAYLPIKEISTRENKYSYDISYGAIYRELPLGSILDSLNQTLDQKIK